MKTKPSIFYFVLFFTVLCAVFSANKRVYHLSQKNQTKNTVSQKATHQVPSEEMFSLDENVSDSNFDGFEKVKFSHSIITQKCMGYFFYKYAFCPKLVAITNDNYTVAPRYILYKALQIAHC